MGEETLFSILEERPMSVSELARKLNVRREYLGGYLEALRDSGKLERIQVGRSYVYRPVSDLAFKSTGNHQSGSFGSFGTAGVFSDNSVMDSIPRLNEEEEE